MKVIKFMLEIIGWCQVTLGVTVIAALPAYLVYLQFPSTNGQYAAFSIILIGFIAGACCATYIWKKHGILQWLGRITRIS